MYSQYEELFESYKDNFKRYQYIESNLIYGDKNLIENPMISIVIPTYRRADLLRFALKSAINQIDVECDYEVIIVDNESSSIQTETEKIVRAFNDRKIVYYRNEKNIGMFGNWNRCIELARGEWVSFLHDDDMLDSKYIHKVVKILKKKKNAGAVSGQFAVINNNEEHLAINNKKYIFETFINRLKEYKLIRLYPFDSQISNSNVYGAPTCGNIFRKSFLLHLGGFDEDYFPSADWFFTLKYSKMYKFYKTNSQFGYYRVFENESLNPETLKKFIIQAEEVRKYYAEKTIFGKVLKIFFANEQYFSTLSWVKNMGSKSDVDFEEINGEYGYRYRPMRFKIYKFIQFIYWRYIKRIISLIVG